jgi:hypothetical protein
MSTNLHGVMFQETYLMEIAVRTPAFTGAVSLVLLAGGEQR